MESEASHGRKPERDRQGAAPKQGAQSAGLAQTGQSVASSKPKSKNSSGQGGLTLGKKPKTPSKNKK